MQRIDEEKRKRIIEIAGKLFSSRPFHDVRLEDVAAEARIGKGTIYVYFKSKADLCYSLIYESQSAAIDGLRSEIHTDGLSAVQLIGRILGYLASFMERRVYLRGMINDLGLTERQRRSLFKKRDEMLAIIEAVLHDGIARGEFTDPHPEMTAKYLLAILREFLIEPDSHVKPDVLIEHATSVLCHGISRK